MLDGAGLQFGLQLVSSLTPQRLVHPLTGVPHLERGNVGVPLRYRHPGVAKNLLHDADMHALLDKQSRGGVAGVVDPLSTHLGSAPVRKMGQGRRRLKCRPQPGNREHG